MHLKQASWNLHKALHRGSQGRQAIESSLQISQPAEGLLWDLSPEESGFSPRSQKSPPSLTEPPTRGLDALLAVSHDGPINSDNLCRDATSVGPGMRDPVKNPGSSWVQEEGMEGKAGRTLSSFSYSLPSQVGPQSWHRLASWVQSKLSVPYSDLPSPCKGVE